MEVAPASSEFSMSSLMTDAGRWTTSPAAMRSTTCFGKAWIRGFSSGIGEESIVIVEERCCDEEGIFLDLQIFNIYLVALFKRLVFWSCLVCAQA